MKKSTLSSTVIALALLVLVGSSLDPIFIGDIGSSQFAKPVVTASSLVTPTRGLPTEVATATPKIATKTATQLPSATPTVANTRTVTFVPTVVDDGRRWSLEQFGRYIGTVGGRIVYDPSLPSDDPMIELFTKTFVFVDKGSTGSWLTGPIEKVIPSEICAWTYTQTMEDRGRRIVFEGNVMQLEDTQAELWARVVRYLGDRNTEPYCPEFDKLVPTPTFGNAVVSTQTASPTVADDGRRWNLEQFGAYQAFAGSYITSDPAFPQDDPMVEVFDKFKWVDTGLPLGWVLEGPIEIIIPSQVCAWTHKYIMLGVGRVYVNSEGTRFEMTRGELWDQIASAVGYTGKEPYCPEFDVLLPAPIFDGSN